MKNAGSGSCTSIANNDLHWYNQSMGDNGPVWNIWSLNPFIQPTCNDNNPDCIRIAIKSVSYEGWEDSSCASSTYGATHIYSLCEMICARKQVLCHLLYNGGIILPNYNIFGHFGLQNLPTPMFYNFFVQRRLFWVDYCIKRKDIRGS